MSIIGISSKTYKYVADARRKFIYTIALCSLVLQVVPKKVKQHLLFPENVLSPIH